MTDISHLSNLESSGDLLIDFGLQPVSNRFRFNNSVEAPRFPLQLNICEETGLLHLARPFPVDEVRPQYDWLTCYEPEEHLDDLVKTIIKLPNINQNSVFGAYSFKDDSTLNRLIKRGYVHTWRIDPVQDMGIGDKCANIETYQSVFNENKADNIKKRHGPADVLIVRHVVEHAYNLPMFINSIKKLIKPDGYVVWELPDCERALAMGDCTTVWEEHVFYFTSFTFRQLLNSADFEIIHFESVPYPLENSIIAVTRKTSVKHVCAALDKQLVSDELDRARNFSESFNKKKSNIRKKLENIRSKHGEIALFGAGHLSVAFLSLLDITDLFNCVLDDNPHKKGMLMPTGDLEIVGSDKLYNGKISVCLLSLNPQNQPKVLTKHQKYRESGGIFASIFPGSELYLEEVL